MIWRATLLLALLPLGAARAAGPSVETFTIRDRAYGMERTVGLYRSPGAGDPAKHGYNLFVFLQREYAEELAVPERLQELVASGQIPPVVAVILDTSNLRPQDIANRVQFDRFITADLIPWLRAKLGSLPGPKNVVIAGFSVGGLTAAYVAHRHPEIFGNVLAQSGAFWRGNEGATEPAEWLTNELRNQPRLPIRFYIEVGSGETRTTPSGVGFLEANRHLRDVLASKKYTFRYKEVPRDIHDPDHLRPTLADGILYLSKPER